LSGVIFVTDEWVLAALKKQDSLAACSARAGQVMHRIILFIVTVAVGLTSSEGAGPPARADELPVVRHKVVRACNGPLCGPYAPCGARCRVSCPDGYSCYPLYGAYGPYGGVAFWGAYTYSGWGRAW
jgi:hypothetical protein